MLSISFISVLVPFLSPARGAVINPRESLTPPAECDVIPTWEVTSFSWFNSSHNLDCVSGLNVRGLVGCDGNLGPCDRCGVPGCYTGLPLQPAGYGPPDTVAISIPSVPGYGSCFESNPQSIRRYDVGSGPVLCAGVAYHITFVGDSSVDVSSGRIDFDPIQAWDCYNGSTIRASGGVDFDIECSRDAGNNATCVIPDGESVVIPVLSYQIT